MQELSGNAPAGNGDAPQRIEAGPGGYDNGPGEGYGGESDRDLKPWQRGPTGASAPWARGGDDQGRRDDLQRDGGSAPPWAGGGRGSSGNSYGGYNQQASGYGAPSLGPPGGAAPWQRQHDAPPPPPGGQSGYGYGGYPGGGYGDSAGYGPPQSMGAPPGLGGGPIGLGAPPGLGALFQNYGSVGNAPPPPPPGDAPPPVSQAPSSHAPSIWNA